MMIDFSMIEVLSPKEDLALGLYDFLLLMAAVGVNILPACLLIFSFSY